MKVSFLIVFLVGIDARSTGARVADPFFSRPAIAILHLFAAIHAAKSVSG
ncbi:MAG: hypothetical protein IPM02_22105 [Betaproteobacteria bacterium]|nr:hypothetical protein [Betaproteobacteria bacterium]